jgi:hypothetical protein
MRIALLLMISLLACKAPDTSVADGLYSELRECRQQLDATRAASEEIALACDLANGTRMVRATFHGGNAMADCERRRTVESGCLGNAMPTFCTYVAGRR